jgi:mannosyl-3-phosphoglycerate phosphatase
VTTAKNPDRLSGTMFYPGLEVPYTAQREGFLSMRRILILTDLDGSLLDACSYSYSAAHAALSAIQRISAALVLVSSKTRSEMEPIRLRLDNRHPFIVENGGALFIPHGYFPFPLQDSTRRGEYDVVELGTPYDKLRAALKDMSHTLGTRLQGFGDLSLEEVAQLTGLSPADALLATQREYDEPFVAEGASIPWNYLLEAAAIRGLRCTRGGRFYHLMGANDKGIASRRLIAWYRRLAEIENQTLVTIGVGDSLNDLPMLATVDYPILVQKPDHSYDPDVQLPHLTRAVGVGPVGWNRSLIDLLPTL